MDKMRGCVKKTCAALSAFVKEHKNIIRNGAANLALLILAYGGLLRRSFVTDTVGHMMMEKIDGLYRMEEGRYLSGLCDFLLTQLGRRTTDHTGVTVFLGLLLMAAAIGLIQEMFRSHMAIQGSLEEAAYVALTSLVFINVLAVELLMFGEMAHYFGAAFFFAAWGAYLFANKRYVKAIICIAISSMFYQTGIFFFAMLVSAHIFLENKKKITKTGIIRQTIALLIMAGVGFANILSTRVCSMLFENFEASRSVGGSIRDNLPTVVWHVYHMFRSSFLLPPLWLPLIFSGTMAVIFIWRMLKEKNYHAIIYYLLLQLLLLILIYPLSLIGSYASPPHRMVFTFYLVQACAGLIAFIHAKQMTRKMLCFVFMFYLFIQIFFVQIIVTQHFVSNSLDKLYANMVYAEIVAYEAETGTAVTKLSVGRDRVNKAAYDEVSYANHNINERVMGMLNWSLVEMVSGRRFEHLLMDKEFQAEHFGDKDWDYINLSEQLIIEGDTAYWVIF